MKPFWKRTKEDHCHNLENEFGSFNFLWKSISRGEWRLNLTEEADILSYKIHHRLAAVQGDQKEEKRSPENPSPGTSFNVIWIGDQIEGHNSIFFFELTAERKGLVGFSDVRQSRFSNLLRFGKWNFLKTFQAIFLLAPPWTFLLLLNGFKRNCSQGILFHKFSEEDFLKTFLIFLSPELNWSSIKFIKIFNVGRVK